MTIERTREFWGCQGCGRVGTSARDLLAQGCEGKPERLVSTNLARANPAGSPKVWPQTVSDAYHNARREESDDAFSVEVVPAEWWENIAAQLDASRAAWKAEVDQAHDLTRELYETLKAGAANGYDEEFIADADAATARYEQEVGG